MDLRCKMLLFFLLVFRIVGAQQDPFHVGIHQLESLQFRSRGDSALLQMQPAPEKPTPLLTYKKADLTRKVFGWHPYWASASAYLSYDYTVLSHLAYFSYETDTVTGGYKTINGWDQTPIIDYAHQQGCKVILTVTNFGTAANKAILRDTLKQIKMIQTITSLLKSRNGDGVNFDLESVAAAYRTNLTSFMRRAVKMIKSELPAAEISMATPAVDWSGSWDLPALAGICDYLIVMGYDYYWASSPTAGPVAPLVGESYNVTKTVDTYLTAGVPSQKLMLGVPWFGYNWPVATADRKATATGTAAAVTAAVAETLSANYSKTFDLVTKVPWLSYKDGSAVNHQIWYDDQLSYNYKFDLVNSRNLAGIGIWALSYENGKKEIWKGILAAFSTTGTSEIVLNQMIINYLAIYPNPVVSVATIRFALTEPLHAELKVVDLTGKLIATVLNADLPADANTVSMDCSGFQSGVYLLVFTTNKGNLTRKFVVKSN